MGRGRAKAKQTKVARKLKYSGPDTDLGALEDELTGRSREADVEEQEEVEDDPYAQYAERYNDDERGENK
ncbi:MAG: DUF3073 domain-containing protein [Actinobacteria bacterium]|nr:DUF3073 domain-containing protein [Actinomycetota bacterium]